MRLLERKHLTIDLYDEPVRHLATTWVGYSTRNDFLSGIDTITGIMLEQNIRHVLNDIRRQQAVGIESQGIAAARILRYIETYGTFRQAMIITDDVYIKFAAMNFDNRIRNQGNCDVNRFFSTPQDGLSWLVQQRVLVSAG
jgi:hypothetical protein